MKKRGYWEVRKFGNVLKLGSVLKLGRLEDWKLSERMAGGGQRLGNQRSERMAVSGRRLALSEADLWD